MPTNLVNSALYLAMSVSHNHQQKDVAILVDYKTKVVKAIGVASSNSVFETKSAIVNLVQNAKPGKKDVIVLSTSTPPPWHRDEGLLRMAASKAGKYKKITPSILFYNWTSNRPELRTLSSKRAWYNANSGKAKYKNLFDAFSEEINLGVDAAFQAVYPGNNFNNERFVANLQACNAWYTRNEDAELNLIKTFKAALNDKTYTAYNQAPSLTLPAGMQNPAGDKNEASINKIFSQLSWAIVEQGMIAKGKNTIPKGHNIGSVLRGTNDEILAWGINTNKDRSFSLHGEVNLLQNHQTANGNVAQALPDGTKLYSTLEPCYMCAGMYVNKVNRPRIFPDPTVICYYEQKDHYISDNSLEGRAYQSSQGINPNPGVIGENIEAAYQQDKRIKGGNFLALTDYLDRDIAKKLIALSTLGYVRLCPKKKDNARAAWEGGTRERTIWENGLKLLHHIDNGVAAVWEKDTDRYYEGVIPKV